MVRCAPTPTTTTTSALSARRARLQPDPGTGCIPRPARGISPWDRLGPGWLRRSVATAPEWRARPVSNAAVSNAAASNAVKIWRSLASERLEAEPWPSGRSSGNPIQAARHPPTTAQTSPQRLAATPGFLPSFLPTNGHCPSRFSSDSHRLFGESRNGARVSIYPAPAKPPAADVSLGTGGKQLTT